jgi:plastocyanin
MVAGSYWFRPDRISVRAGAPVELRIDRDTALVPHNFSLHAPDAGIDVDLDLGGGLNVVRFTPSKAGEYAFYCDLGSHEEKGMHGTLVVREK